MMYMRQTSSVRNPCLIMMLFKRCQSRPETFLIPQFEIFFWKSLLIVSYIFTSSLAYFSSSSYMSLAIAVYHTLSSSSNLKNSGHYFFLSLLTFSAVIFLSSFNFLFLRFFLTFFIIQHSLLSCFS